MRSIVVIVLLGCALAAAAVWSGCGSEADVPSDAVARVGDVVIAQTTFDEMAARTKVTRMSFGGGARIYDPPDFDDCVAAKKANGPVAGGEQLPPDKELRSRCQGEFTQIRTTVMSKLIEREWLRQEARRLDLDLGKRDIGRQLDEYLRTATPAQRQEFRAGANSAGGKKQVIAQLRDDQMTNELVRRAKDRAPKVTDADVQRYYDAHSSELGAPEERDVRLVLTLDKAEAERARAALEEGTDWKRVAKRYSVDPSTKSRAGLTEGMKNGDLDQKSVDDAIFAADTGTIEGPVESQFGWYVFEVVAVDAASGRSLADARDRIERRLRKQRRDAALDQYNRELGDRYFNQTSCADEYKINLCGNG